MFIIDSQQIETAQKKFIKTITFDNLIVFNIETAEWNEFSINLFLEKTDLTPFCGFALERGFMIYGNFSFL